MTQVACAVGARVILMGLASDEARLELGRALGASHTLHVDSDDFAMQLRRICDPEAIDIVFECSGAGPALQHAVEIVRKKGRVVQVGLFGKSIAVDMDRVVLKDITIRGSFASSRRSWEQALGLIQQGLIDTRALVSDIFPLEDWEQAFSRASSRGGLKVVFTPNPD
jgi:L-iditol 2-dehydrogenase